MRKIQLIAALLFITFAANAQTEKGDWMVGGRFSLNTSDNNTEIALTPSAGMFIIRNLAVGGNVQLAYDKDGLIKTTSFGIGPFVRYYFTSADVRPIIHGNFNFLSAKTKLNGTSSSNNGTNFFLGGGAAIFISDHVSLDAVLGYDHTDYNGLPGGGGFAMNVGFQVYLFKQQMDRVRGVR